MTASKSTPSPSPEADGPAAGTFLAVAALVLAAAFWAGNQVVGRMVAEAIPPISLSFLRWSVACLLLLVVAGPRVPGQWDQIKANWKLLLALALTGMVGFHTLLYLALANTYAIHVAIYNALIPIFILLLSWAFFGDRPTLRQSLGLLLTVAGAVALVSRGDIAVLAALDVNGGDLIALGAMVFWAVYTLLLKRLPRSIDPWIVLLTTGLMAWAVLTPLAFWETGPWGPWPGWRPSLTWPIVLPVLYVAIGASFISFASFNHGVAVLGPVRAGPYLNLIPVFGVVFAVLILGETVRSYHLAGCVLVLGGLLLASKPGFGVDRRLRGTP